MNEARSPEAVLTAVGDLATAAEQAALVRLALSSGLLQRCAEPIAVDDLADILQIPRERLSGVCDALVAMGALVHDGTRVRLSATWTPLADDGVHVTLERALVGAEARRSVMATALSPSADYWEADARQRLALADGVTMATTTEFGRTAVSGVLAALPEVTEQLRTGARWLELGCGVAGMLLGVLHAHSSVTAVGVDLASDLLAVARERARELGVADRIDFVEGDATAYTDDEPFDIVFWSQFFFPTRTRTAALANAFARLRPGGLLLCPLVPGDLEPYGTGSALAQQSSLHALVFSGWDIPIRSGDTLTEELEEAGFQVRRVHRDGLPVTVVAQRPAA
ncbi:hypothetical protein GCM10027271_20100 [Saccharopolyspora gloriosae]|uniref:SAM-dependent methyltransferase n=1 Tax=Saccharopolyspora gloriosae TaxID=455344 RepID=A0A840NBG6_9PSEU|nr:class I SAM-dependent methyltransferase [Saccharopolyspora gloriosae]MBB5067558.1 SAM-dependent methyltransferase [Saccharopolyspora gloriosae]